MADSLAYEWGCSCCGGQYDRLPLKWVANSPQAFDDLTEAEQARGDLGEDYCVIGERDHYVLGHIEIPVADIKEIFTWGAWAFVSRKDADAIRAGKPGAYEGKLNTSLPLYPETDGLDVVIQVRAADEIPRLTVQGKHPLAMEQRNGIALKLVVSIASTMMQGV